MAFYIQKVKGLLHRYIQQKMLNAINQDNNCAGASNSEVLIVVEFCKDSFGWLLSFPSFLLFTFVETKQKVLNGAIAD